MQACIVIGGKSREDGSLDEIAKALAKGLESQGHTVDILNIYTDSDRKLSFYDYVIVGTTATTQSQCRDEA